MLVNSPMKEKNEAAAFSTYEVCRDGVRNLVGNKSLHNILGVTIENEALEGTLIPLNR